MEYCVPTIHFRRWLRGLIAADCVLCGVAPGAPDVCVGCQHDFLAPRPRCSRCAAPVRADPALCAACLREPPHFDATFTLADYTAPIDAVVHALKYGHRLELAPILGALLARHAAALDPRPTVCVPVPLSFERLAERGFNQAHEIARTAAADALVRLDPRLLLRVRHAPAQASLRLDARRRNIRGAFAARHRIPGEHVAVIDDVMTTGSTLDEAARVLKAAGAAHVTNLVVARTP
jgi:ComF family protein